jgi:predicted methyltransferase
MSRGRRASINHSVPVNLSAAFEAACQQGGIQGTEARWRIRHHRPRGAVRIGLRDTDTLHRIDPASIIREVQAAGFVLEAQSDLLRNPADTHMSMVFDPQIRGHTDQVFLRFRKPLQQRASPIALK